TIRGELSSRYVPSGAGGMSYFSRGSVRRPGYGAVCPQAVASEASKIKRLVIETVEDLIWSYVECVVKQFPPLFALATCSGPTNAFATRDLQSRIASPPLARFPYFRTGVLSRIICNDSVTN